MTDSLILQLPNAVIPMPQLVPTPVDPSLLAKHYYDNHEAYKLEFFSKTIRMDSAPFHAAIEKQLWSGKRKNGFKVFRDGAKTTLLRVFTGKRIAYGISRTILYVSNSLDSTKFSIDWLKKQVKGNEKWATFYGLQEGNVWASDHIEIYHSLLGITITVIATGIKGQIRGINIDDWRPDLIVVDDADDEETTNTPEQCRKYVKLFFGAIVHSLAPASENPYAMVAVLQTPLASGDIISTCAADPEWNVLDVSCFDAKGESSWPMRYPTSVLLADKASMTAKRLLSVWLREMEVTIGSDEGCDFDASWLKYWDVLPEKFDEMCIAIDPASSDRKTADDNAISLWGKAGGMYYLIAYAAEIGQTHIQTSQALFNIFFPLGKKLLGRNPIVAVETIGYQKNLKAQIEADMRVYQLFFAVVSVNDRRAKRDRILQSFHGNSYAGLIHCHASHVKFVEQFTLYSKDIPKDDVIDSSSMAVFQLDPMGTSFKKVHRGGVTRKFGSTSLTRVTTRVFGTQRGQLYG